MVVAASGENWENVGCGVITTEQEFSFATASSPDFTGSSTLEQSTSLDRVFNHSIIHLLNLYLRTSLAIFSTKLLEIYVELSLGLYACNALFLCNREDIYQYKYDYCGI